MHRLLLSEVRDLCPWVDSVPFKPNWRVESVYESSRCFGKPRWAAPGKSKDWLTSLPAATCSPRWHHPVFYRESPIGNQNIGCGQLRAFTAVLGLSYVTIWKHILRGWTLSCLFKVPVTSHIISILIQNYRKKLVSKHRNHYPKFTKNICAFKYMRGCFPNYF